MSTPHNQAEKGEIAKIVLMPGDPLRAKFIADSFLTDVKQFNSVRNVFGYTGKYKGKEVSVMASGMGIPSIGIYSYELYKYYDVEKIVRLGSAGAYFGDINLYETVLVTGAYSESTYAYAQSNDTDKIQLPSKEFNEELKAAADKLGIKVREGYTHSSDAFYVEALAENHVEEAKKAGCICVEMESFGLFHNAKVFNKQAACLLTISDNLVTHEETTHEERRYALVNMMKIALEAAVAD